MSQPRQILGGVFHWRAPHPVLGVEVDSWWLEGAGILVDPIVPADGGIEWFTSRPRTPAAIILSNRHHYRHSDRFTERFGLGPVRAPRAGMHEFGPERPAEPYDPGDEVAGGVVAYEVDAICPDDMCLHIPAAEAVVFADGIVLGGTEGSERILGFVPDSFMDNPEQTRQGLLEAVKRLLDELDFRHVLCAHGGPLLDTGRRELEELVRIGGRTAFEM